MGSGRLPSSSLTADAQDLFVSNCHIFWYCRVSDVFFGHMKLFLLLLNVTCILSTFWFLLIAQKYIEYSRGRCLHELSFYLLFMLLRMIIPVFSTYSFDQPI